MSLPEAADRIIARLRKGQPWLCSEYNALMALPDLGLGSPREAKWLEWLDVWDSLDQILRFVYGFTHCPQIGVCLADAPVVCRACARKQGQETTI